MSTLAIAACVAGAVIAALYLPAVLAPGLCRKAVLAFPRNAPAAWFLTAVDLSWVAWIVLHAALGRFEFLKPWVYAAAPLSFLALVLLLDELLAPRALGGLMLLAASPVLVAARWQDTPLRLVPVVLAYVVAVAGMSLVLSPHYFRRALAFWIASDARCRTGGGLGVLLGAVLVVLGLAVY